MTRGMTAHQAQRHPFAFGLFVLIFSPYILGAMLLFAIVWLILVVARTLLVKR